MIATTIFTAICLKKLPKSLSVRGEKSPHIKEYLDVEEELADVIIVALSTLHHFKCDIDSLIEAKMNYNKNRMD
jgi:hypothetical protein